MKKFPMLSKIKALNDSLTPVAFTPQSNLNYINSSYPGIKSCFRIGKMCFVSIKGFRFGASTPAYTQIFTNLPDADQYVCGYAMTNVGQVMAFSTSGTTIVNDTTPSQGVDYTLSFCYVAK